MRIQGGKRCAVGLILVLIVAQAGCSSTIPEHPTTRALRDVRPARSAPIIAAAVDLGFQRTPPEGQLNKGISDGVATIGELLMVWGRGFGKQPTIAIAKQPTEVLAHLDGGGIVVRVPPGVPAGEVTLTVRNGYGQAHTAIRVRRLGLVAGLKGLKAFSLGKHGTLQLRGELLPKVVVKRLLMPSDGACAYAIGQNSKEVRLYVIDMASPTPRVADSDPLSGRVFQTAAVALESPRAVIVTDTSFTFIDSSISCAPALFHPTPIPRGYLDRPLTGATLSPNGRALALLANSSNEVLLFDTQEPKGVGTPNALPLLPAARVSRWTEASFTLDARAVWVLGGDTPASMSTGHHPIIVSSLPVNGALPAGQSLRWEASAEFVPVSSAMDRSTPTPSGTSIGDRISGSSLYITTQPISRLEASAGSVGSGALWRVDRKKTAKLLYRGALLGSVTVGSHPQIAVAEGLLIKNGQSTHMLIAQPAWTGARAHTLSLGETKAVGGLWKRPLCMQR